jgi:transposase InsO family protein
MTKGLGMEEVISAPRSPWQNPYVERLIGSIRRECLDQIIVWNERSLRRTLKDYFAYYLRCNDDRAGEIGPTFHFMTRHDLVLANDRPWLI